MLCLTLMSTKAASLPPHIGSKLGLRLSIIALVMFRAGRKLDVETGIVFCLTVRLQPKEDCSLDVGREPHSG